MLKKIVKVILGLIGAVIGYNSIVMLGVAEEIDFSTSNIGRFLISKQFIGIIIGAIIGYFLIFFLLEKLLDLILNFDYKLKELSWKKIIISFLGIIIGLIFGSLINLAFSISSIPGLGLSLQILINVIFIYLGLTLAIYKFNDIFDLLFENKKFFSSNKNKDLTKKILDTSVIIDGRIYDICQTGFVEGKLMIPEFVLEELRHIADSSDGLKRNRGRRGLDILKKMQKDNRIDVDIVAKNYEDIPEVDSKLVKMAQEYKAKIVTNDFNLNKVSELQGVFVLNINELANAVKPVVLPGEEMDVKVIKEGKEDRQGIGYLDDGTMIVVDNGVEYMDEDIVVMVTSILQTAAGRMIFAKPNTNS
ncbi:MAG: twitching motility protein PilT [Halanaerobiales bacterium]|nr:twitching motility protein PilT [Halanaerobiales bacterium]